ncbi:hypothetical protein AB0N09_30925 [Streptomyces erythrochromogenes]|uniref:hypothetical protein n=1 Tax=Streptomyces erythrochromogenes TaxID=285574 RepID=UPI0034136F5F
MARLVVGTGSSYEFGTRWSFEAFAHHTDGSVTRDLDFANSCYQMLEDLSDLLDPYQGDELVIDVPGVTMLVAVCTTCHDTRCKGMAAGWEITRGVPRSLHRPAPRAPAGRVPRLLVPARLRPVAEVISGDGSRRGDRPR